MNDASFVPADKFRRYRDRKKAGGLREIRLWTVDVDAPGFWEKTIAEAAALRDAPGEEDTMVFVEAVQASDPGSWD